MNIQVLGSGCATCHKLFELTRKAVGELGLPDTVEYVTDVNRIIEMGLMQSPVLAVDGKPVMVGFVPDIHAIKQAIRQAGEENAEACCGSGQCKCGK